MYLVVAHGWRKEDAEVAQSIAETLGSVAYEARQKIAGGGPAVLASFAAVQQAGVVAESLKRAGVPALVVDTREVRKRPEAFYARRFKLEAQALYLESFSGALRTVDYAQMMFLILSICPAGPNQAENIETKRKFSLGKTLLAGGIPMTREVKIKKAATVSERDQTLWLYAAEEPPIILARSVLNFDGLGKAMQFTRDLNFNYLKSELRQLAPQAIFNDLLLNRARLVRVLGTSLDPDADLDLAVEIVMRSLRDKAARAAENCQPENGGFFLSLDPKP